MYLKIRDNEGALLAGLLMPTLSATTRQTIVWAELVVPIIATGYAASIELLTELDIPVFSGPIPDTLLREEFRHLMAGGTIRFAPFVITLGTILPSQPVPSPPSEPQPLPSDALRCLSFQ